jgi:hypothetical protein
VDIHLFIPFEKKFGLVFLLEKIGMPPTDFAVLQINASIQSEIAGGQPKIKVECEPGIFGCCCQHATEAQCE